MHILWLKSDFIDPPDTGGKIRTYNILRHLRNFCEVTYLCPRDPNFANGTTTHPWASTVVTFPHREESKEGLEFYSRIFRRMFSRVPFIVQKYRSKGIQQYQQNIFSANGSVTPRGRKTIILCDFLEMAGNVAWSTPFPKILFQHNVESVIWRRYFENEKNQLKKAYFKFEHQRLKSFESATCNRFDRVITVSSRDKDLLQNDMQVTKPIDVIETGVDVDFFAPPPEPKTIPGRLLFLGSLDWMPNIDGINWFVCHVYWRIKKQCPHVTLDIVGRRPTASILALAHKDPSIKIYGSVSDVRPYIAEADLFIVPLRIGSGTRLKIYEAMAAKRPVVSTTIGAEGLPVRHGRHLFLADSVEEFSERVVSLLNEPSQKKAVAAEGYQFVTENYSWEKIAKQLFDICSNVPN